MLKNILMRNTARAVLTYPLFERGTAYTSVMLVRDARCVQSGKKEIYALPGGGIEEGESAEEAVRREVREELGLTLKNAVKWKSVGRHTLFFPCEAQGVLDQHSLGTNEIQGLAFVHRGNYKKIIPYMQQNTSLFIEELLQSVNPRWEKGVQPTFKVRGYFFTGNTNGAFEDWQQQKNRMGVK